jgi:hypothetical protein
MRSLDEFDFVVVVDDWNQNGKVDAQELKVDAAAR